VRKRPPGQEGHNDVHSLWRRTEVQDTADVRMHQPRSSLRLTTEALPHFVFLRQVRMQHLQRQRTTQLMVNGVVHIRHSAATYTPDNTIAVARHPPEVREFLVRLLSRSIGQLRQHGVAPRTTHRTRAAPGSTLRTEQISLRRSEEHTSELQSRENLVCR